MVSSLIAPIVDASRRALAAAAPMRLAVLFGSAAAGRLRPASDVDIAIWPSDPGLSLATELDLQADLERALGRSVDLVRLDSASTLVRWQVARDGLLLIAEPASEWPRFRAAAASEWESFAPSFAEASRVFQQRLIATGRRDR